MAKGSGTVPLESLIPRDRRPSTSRQTHPGEYGLGRCGGRRERPDSAKGSRSWQPSVPLQICFIVPAHHQVFVRLCVPVLGSGPWPPDAWLSSSYPQLLRVCARLELCPHHSQRGTFLHASPRLTHQGRLRVHDALQPPHLRCGASSISTRKGCSQSAGSPPSLESGLCQGQAGVPPLNFNGRVRATPGLFGLEMHAEMPSELPQFSKKGILAPKTKDQRSGMGLIRSRGLHFRKG